MLVSATYLLASLLSLSGHVVARLPDGRLSANHLPLPGLPKVTKLEGRDVNSATGLNGIEIPPYDVVHYFDQLIDHNDPSKGTFKVRYWLAWEYYRHGGPIILTTAGASKADDHWVYLTNQTINGQIAQQEGGATIVLEHRFYGLSNPYPDLSVKSLQVHTIDQAIEDFDYFAKNVKLPFPGGDLVGPDRVPWVFVGGGYSGALAAWLRVAKPDTFYAAYSSSGTIEAIVDFSRYFDPIREHMPANCSADVQAVIAHVDEVFSGNNKTATSELKGLFGLGDLSYPDDVAGALQWDLFTWQSLQPTSGPNAPFFKFCDALEVNGGVSAPASGRGLEHALPAWGNYFKTVTLPALCGSNTANVEDCFGTHNPDLEFWTNTSINNQYRSWFWIQCRELGWWKTGPSQGPTLVSRLIRPEWFERQCRLMFEGAFPHLPVPDTVRTNNKYHGWNVKRDRLFFANGHRDPWREATISAETKHFTGTSQQPIEISNGFYSSDLMMAEGIDPTVAAVQDKALALFKKWIATFITYAPTFIPTPAPTLSRS